MIFLIKVFIVVNSEPEMLCTGTGGINNNNIVEYCRLRLASTSTPYGTTTQLLSIVDGHCVVKFVCSSTPLLLFSLIQCNFHWYHSIARRDPTQEVQRSKNPFKSFNYLEEYCLVS